MSAAHFNEDHCLDGAEGRSQQFDEADRRHKEFDWDGLYERLGETVPDVRTELVAAVSEFAARLGQHLIGDEPIGRGSDRVIGRRAVACLWALRPDLFDGKSLTQIARQLQISPACLAVRSGEFSRTFGLRFTSQCHSIRRSSIESKDEPERHDDSHEDEGGADEQP